MKKFFILILFIFVVFSFLSCGLTSKNQEIKIETIKIGKVSDVFSATFDQLGIILRDPENDNKISEIKETDLIGVTAIEDKDYIRFDVYHKTLISGNYDVYYGFYDIYSDGIIEYRYFPSDGAFYAIFYDSKGNYKESLELDLEKVDDYIKAWSLDNNYKYNIVTFVLNKKTHFGTKANQSIILYFNSGYYDTKNKKINNSDYTDYVNLIINN